MGVITFSEIFPEPCFSILVSTVTVTFPMAPKTGGFRDRGGNNCINMRPAHTHTDTGDVTPPHCELCHTSQTSAFIKWVELGQ